MSKIDFTSFAAGEAAQALPEGAVNLIPANTPADALALLVKTEDGRNVAVLAPTFNDLEKVAEELLALATRKVIKLAYDYEEGDDVTIGAAFKQKPDETVYKTLFPALQAFFVQISKGKFKPKMAQLRRVFASATFAGQQFPSVKQDAWLKALGYAKELAAKNNLSPEIFASWERTRDRASVKTRTTDLVLDI